MKTTSVTHGLIDLQRKEVTKDASRVKRAPYFCLLLRRPDACPSEGPDTSYVFRVAQIPE